MANFNNVTVPSNDWVNVNTLAGVTVGNAFNIQNTSGVAVMLAESASKPVNENAAVLYPPHYGELSKASVDAGSTIMWAKAVASTENTVTALLRVYD